MLAQNKTNRTLDDVLISQELIDVLNILIPERCPDIADSDRQIWLYAGERSLVKKLNVAFMRQQNKGEYPCVFRSSVTSSNVKMKQ